ncbi:unnamed protein product [Protopolystoma xenopodis]|uniref:BPTI/Kunitz inhibitor domain-containing protein n=1 Tax=Protopolystoma xenopodis TaxID=117903 RepID=A0A448XE01_9PLAT|nr:unnamed protein product [Protopolystoma xenopodis]
MARVDCRVLTIFQMKPASLHSFTDLLGSSDHALASVPEILQDSCNSDYTIPDPCASDLLSLFSITVQSVKLWREAAAVRAVGETGCLSVGTSRPGAHVCAVATRRQDVALFTEYQNQQNSMRNHGREGKLPTTLKADVHQSLKFGSLMIGKSRGARMAWWRKANSMPCLASLLPFCSQTDPEPCRMAAVYGDCQPVGSCASRNGSVCKTDAQSLKLHRWFFNEQTSRCEVFNFSGCGNTVNFFDDIMACHNACKSRIVMADRKSQVFSLFCVYFHLPPSDLPSIKLLKNRKFIFSI